MTKLTSCVVKIIANNVSIDWLKPYKIDDDSESIGTGFFIDNEGYILTCAHVVIDAIKLWITIPSIGKERIDVEIVGICDNSDLALLKTVAFKPENYLKLGNSDFIESGKKVYAIGYPLGQDKLKKTAGIISGFQDGIFQTDTPINPGNSGGPLCDEEFNVIGINTSKMMFADNVGYSTPILHFKILENEMRKNTGKMIYKPNLFAKFNNTNSDLIEYYGKEDICKSGFFINKIHPKSCLKIAGLKDGDIICSFGKDNEIYKVDNFGECVVPWYNEKIHIMDIMRRFTINDKINITYWRNNAYKLQTVVVDLSIMEIPSIRILYKKYDKIDYVIFSGMVIMQLCANHLQQLFNMDISKKMMDYLSMYAHLKNRYEKVLLITQVFPGSEIGKIEAITSGDVIRCVNNVKVCTLEDLRKALLQMRHSNGKHFFKLQTILNTVTILNVQKILDQEVFLSENFKYKIDPINFKIQKKYNLNFNNKSVQFADFNEFDTMQDSVSHHGMQDSTSHHGMQDSTSHHGMQDSASHHGMQDSTSNKSENFINRFRFTFNDMLSDFDNRNKKGKKCFLN